MTKRVLLAGCGNIGFRHLQALEQMATPAAITIVEPNPAAHPRIAGLIAAHAGPHRFDLRAALPETRQSFDLAVLATSADSRRALVEALLAGHEIGAMILEKVLFQTLTDLDAVGAALDRQGRAAWVNCGRRVFPGYLAGRNAWGPARPLDITVAGAAFGLGSNGIHLLDLAEFLNDAALVSVDATALRPGSVPAKRDGCVEIFGQITARLDNGATLRIQCEDAPAMAIGVTITETDAGADTGGAGLRVHIDELARSHSVNGAPAQPFAAKNVSECPEIYESVLTGAACPLTPYADSARQHRLFLAAILAHLGLPATAPCPIS